MSIIVFEFSQLFFHNSLISRCGARRTRDGRVAIGGSGGVGGAGGGGGVGLGGVSVSASASASAVQAAIRAVAVLLVVVAAVCLALAAAVSARLRSHVAASKKPPHTQPALWPAASMPARCARLLAALAMAVAVGGAEVAVARWWLQLGGLGRRWLLSFGSMPMHRDLHALLSCANSIHSSGSSPARRMVSLKHHAVDICWPPCRRGCRTQEVRNRRGSRSTGIRATCPIHRMRRSSMVSWMLGIPSRSSSELVLMRCSCV